MTRESNEKESLRAYYLKRRDDMLTAEVCEKSDLIIKKLVTSDFYLEASVIHCYVSIKDRNEVRTIGLLKQMLEDGKRVIVPKMLKKGRLAHKEIDSLKGLKVNQWGVAEPDEGDDANLAEIDLIIVPMVAGDRARNRIGYGKGYYDRFLGNIHAKKVGLLYELQLHSSRLIMADHDVRLDLLITENEKI